MNPKDVFVSDIFDNQCFKVLVYILVILKKGLVEEILPNEQTRNVLLVSDGCECILVNKKFFFNNISSEAINELRKMVYFKL